MGNTKLDPVQEDHIEMIRQSSSILMVLINDILDVSKIEAGELKLEEIDFDLAYLITSVIKMNSARLGGKPLEMSYVINEKMPRSFKGDPTRIRQILMNLVNNAIKFTGQRQDYRFGAISREPVKGGGG